MMLKDGHVVPARSSIALQRGENNDTRWAPPVFDVDGVRIAVIFDLDRELEMLPTGVDLIAYFQFNAFDMTGRHCRRSQRRLPQDRIQAQRVVCLYGAGRCL